MNKKQINKIIPKLFLLISSIVIFISFGLFFSLIFNTVEFFNDVSLAQFFFDSTWTPLFALPQYGVSSLLIGTIMVSGLAITIALPIGLMTAIFLSEYAHPLLAKFLKPILEVLAGIPSIVYGFFALTTITPWLQSLYPDEIEFYNALSAAIAMGFMIVPLISSLSQDALNAVPNQLRTGGYALGLTKWEVVKGILMPGAKSGIIAALILGISRAIGETMIVAIAAGIRPSTSWNPLEAVMTLTGYIANVAQSDVDQGSTAYYALYAVGLILFSFTLVLNLLGRRFINRKAKATYV